MRQIILAAGFVLGLPLTAAAGPFADEIEAVLDGHILPGFGAFAEAAILLDTVASAGCAADQPTDHTALHAAYHASFDAWLQISHLRFGPTETEDRAFAIAFWPDTKGFSPKALGGLIAAQDPIVQDPDAFSESSIAGRGLYALDYLLFDDVMRDQGTAAYRCALLQAITQDMARNAQAMSTDWQARYAAALTHPSETGVYAREEDVVRTLFTALSTGLQFTSETRLGRPLGTFDRPRPRRAEAWRSDRALRNVVLSLGALETLATTLAKDAPEIAAALAADFARAQDRLSDLDDPNFAQVSDPAQRLKVEIAQQAIDQIRTRVTTELGPALGVAAGFNALDGD